MTDLISLYGSMLSVLYIHALLVSTLILCGGQKKDPPKGRTPIVSSEVLKNSKEAVGPTGAKKVENVIAMTDSEKERKSKLNEAARQKEEEKKKELLAVEARKKDEELQKQKEKETAEMAKLAQQHLEKEQQEVEAKRQKEKEEEEARQKIEAERKQAEEKRLEEERQKKEAEKKKEDEPKKDDNTVEATQTRGGMTMTEVEKEVTTSEARRLKAIVANDKEVVVGLKLDRHELKWVAEAGQNTVKITNIRDKRMAFKIKISDNNIYNVNPVAGFLEVGQSVDVLIFRKKSPFKDDKIVVHQAEPASDEKDALAVFAKPGSAPVLQLILSRKPAQEAPI